MCKCVKDRGLISKGGLMCVERGAVQQRGEKRVNMSGGVSLQRPLFQIFSNRFKFNCLVSTRVVC